MNEQPEKTLHDRVVKALHIVHDPEIPVNIYDLGLVYECRVDDENGTVKIRMTLTSPACPVAGDMPAMVSAVVGRVEGVTGVDVELTWRPRWTPEMMSEDARLALGF